jgi:hypothetical protein
VVHHKILHIHAVVRHGALANHWLTTIQVHANSSTTSQYALMMLLAFIVSGLDLHGEVGALGLLSDPPGLG